MPYQPHWYKHPLGPPPQFTALAVSYRERHSPMINFPHDSNMPPADSKAKELNERISCHLKINPFFFYHQRAF